MSIHRGGLLRIGDLGFLAVLLSARIAARLTGTGTLPAIAIWVGTPLLFYMYLAAGMAHAVSAFAVAAMLTIWITCASGGRSRGALALGAIGGLIAMVREQDAMLLAGPLVDYLVARGRRAQRATGFQWRTRARAWCRRRGRVFPGLRAADPRVSGLERPARTFASRHEEDDLDFAARAGSPVLAGTRVHRLDADGGALHRRPVPAASARFSHADRSMP